MSMLRSSVSIIQVSDNIIGTEVIYLHVKCQIYTGQNSKLKMFLP